jgi:anthraniloyl-CoA monooxygenase
LYFAILSKLRDPRGEVTVFERNPRGVTYGWGVVFWDDLLDNLRRGDGSSARRIQAGARQWYDQQACVGAQAPAHMGGYGFSIGRSLLLSILTARAEELGVDLRFEHPVDDLARLAGADLVVGADGANSRVRQLGAPHFAPRVDVGRNHYIWLGTHKVFDVFTFAFERTAAGWIWFHGYRFNDDTSTCIVECSPRTFHGLGLDTLGPDEGVALLQDIFARHLDGHRLINQRAGLANTPWLNFTRISNRRWFHHEVVLLGDAAHTTDFSIGSGTKLAIEDAIGLDRALRTCPHRLPDALRTYQHDRAAAVTRRQDAARSSAAWFENVDHHIETDPVRFAYSLRTRRDGAVPLASLSWLLHQATQYTAGRAARRWVSTAKRRARGQPHSKPPT